MDILIFLVVVALFVLPRIASVSGKKPGTGRPGGPIDSRLPGQPLTFSDTIRDEPVPEDIAFDEIPEAFPAPSTIERNAYTEDALYISSEEGPVPAAPAFGAPERVVSPPEAKPLSRRFTVDPKELKRAVVMAEILSPPKALRRR